MITYYEPNPAERRLIDALRSGRYKQTTGALERIRLGDCGEPVGCCCLGVACRESRTAIKVAYDGDEGVVTFDLFMHFLPDTVQDELEWSTDTGLLTFIDRHKVWLSLSTLNDEGFTFDQIADVIEAGLVTRSS